MSNLVNDIVQALEKGSYNPDIENALGNAAFLFEKARGMQPAAWTDEVLAAQITAEDTLRLKKAMVAFVERTGHGSWTLSKCGDQTGLRPVYIAVMRRHLMDDGTELYQAMLALANLGERIFPGSSSSIIDTAANRQFAVTFLESHA